MSSGDLPIMSLNLVSCKQAAVFSDLTAKAKPYYMSRGNLKTQGFFFPHNFCSFMLIPVYPQFHRLSTRSDARAGDVLVQSANIMTAKPKNHENSFRYLLEN